MKKLGIMALALFGSATSLGLILPHTPVMGEKGPIEGVVESNNLAIGNKQFRIYRPQRPEPSSEVMGSPQQTHQIVCGKRGVGDNCMYSWVTGINNLTIGSKRFNVKFVWGTFEEIFKEHKPVFIGNKNEAKQAARAIAIILKKEDPALIGTGQSIYDWRDYTILSGKEGYFTGDGKWVFFISGIAEEELKDRLEQCELTSNRLSRRFPNESNDYWGRLIIPHDGNYYFCGELEDFKRKKTMYAVFTKIEVAP